MRDVSRRDFIRGVAAAGVVTAAGAVVGCTQSEGVEQVWDRETEVLIVGMGDAGLATAITAADAGSQVLIIEKAPEEYAGGNSRVCGQSTWSPQDVSKGVAYFKELTQEYHLADIPDAHIEAYIAEASKNGEWLEKTIGMPTVSFPYPEYPWLENADGTLIIHADGLGLQLIWKALLDAASSRSAITLAYETPLTDLIFDSEGRVIGAKASSDGQEIAIKAKKAVVLCCGGFEWDRVMQSNYTRVPCLAWGTPYNTGDGQKICMKYDIDFWHMNASNPGSMLGTLLPYAPEGFGDCPLGTQPDGGNFIWTDKYGRRFQNEMLDPMHGFSRSAMFYYDALKLEYPRMPLWEVFDETHRTNFGLSIGGAFGWIEQMGGINWSPDLSQEIEAGVVLQASTIEELAAQMQIDPATLAATVERYNRFAAAGVDEDFGRETDKLAQMSGPFYAIQLWPLMVNTDGGPRRNEKAQILRTDGTPVPRLYSSGEFGSIWCWYYQAAGNTGECMAMGRIAGANAAAEAAWDAEA